MTRNITALGDCLQHRELVFSFFQTCVVPEGDTLNNQKVWFLMEFLTGSALWGHFWPHHFLSCSLFLRMSANSSATPPWLSNILTGGLTPCFGCLFVCYRRHYCSMWAAGYASRLAVWIQKIYLLLQYSQSRGAGGFWCTLWRSQLW